MIRPMLVLGLVALFLQGCENLPSWDFWPLEDKAPSPQPEAENVLAADSPKSAPEPVGSAGPQARTEARPGEGSTAGCGRRCRKRPRAPAVKSLVGLDFTGVRDSAGRPCPGGDRSTPATVWAYSGRGCVLNIFFYPHVDGGEFRALTYERSGR